MYQETIGLIGGFGAYASLHFYKRILEVFACDCERDYPHIYMDNDFTMPSRTKALLYGEDYEEVVQKIADSMRKMIMAGADRIILVCGTAHYFLDDVFQIIPEAKSKVMNLIECLGKKLQESKVQNVLVVAAEGTLLKGIYEKKLSAYKISCISPDLSEWGGVIRHLIEKVKRNALDSCDLSDFQVLLDRFQIQDIVLGCTEFPILVDYGRQNFKESKLFSDYVFWDPLEIVLVELKKQLSIHIK